MSEARSLQEAMDAFTAERTDELETFELLAEYLRYFSDLAQEADDPLEMDAQEWEKPLEALMMALLDGDIEPDLHLEDFTVAQLDAEHLRDFLAWFLLREVDIDSLQVSAHGDWLRQWLGFMHEHRMIEPMQYFALLEAVDETLPEAVRACQAAHVLFYLVRHGLGSSPRQREKLFESFIEGHARIINIAGEHVIFGFDNLENYSVQLRLPPALSDLLREGDVADVELGLRDQQWVVVDSGPVYPPCIYMEAEYLDIPEKVIPHDPE